MIKKLIVLLLVVWVHSVMALWSHKNISQAVFSTSIVDRQPAKIITEADDSLGKIYFFTNIRHLAGDKITYRWIYKCKVKIFGTRG